MDRPRAAPLLPRFGIVATRTTTDRDQGSSPTVEKVTGMA